MTPEQLNDDQGDRALQARMARERADDVLTRRLDSEWIFAVSAERVAQTEHRIAAVRNLMERLGKGPSNDE